MWEHLVIAGGALVAFHQFIKTIIDAYKYFVKNERTVKRHTKEVLDVLNPRKSGNGKSKRRVQRKAGTKKRSANLDGESEPLEEKLS